MNDAKFDELVGKTLVEIRGKVGDEEMVFTLEDGRELRMFHDKDCCESVSVEDICGDLSDLIGTPILQAEESTTDENPDGIKVPDYQDSFTWTFYRIATVRGAVTIRWYGESNGYYSEGVDCAWVHSSNRGVRVNHERQRNDCKPAPRCWQF